MKSKRVNKKTIPSLAISLKEFQKIGVKTDKNKKFLNREEDQS